jgi:hypothetical protein
MLRAKEASSALMESSAALNEIELAPLPARNAAGSREAGKVRFTPPNLQNQDGFQAAGTLIRNRNLDTQDGPKPTLDRQPALVAVSP